MALQKKLVASSLRAKRGTLTNVIIEGKNKSGKYYGRSYREAPDIDGIVLVNSDKPLNIGDIVEIKITHTYDYDSEGELI